MTFQKIIEENIKELAKATHTNLGARIIAGAIYIGSARIAEAIDNAATRLENAHRRGHLS